MNSEILTIKHKTDHYFAMRKVKNFAQQIGFSDSDCDSLAIVVTELSQNIYNHATQGTICLNPILDTSKKGIEIIANDYGPGIKDISQAIEQGFSTKETLGLGLPGIKRLMDEFIFDDLKNKGTKITCRKWLNRSRIKKENDFFIYIKPLLSPMECGDTGIILESDDNLFVALIDVVGHGREAYDLANKTTTFLRTNFQSDLTTLIKNLHQEVLGSRGLVCSFILLDLKSYHLSYVGVGNVLTKVISTKQHNHHFLNTFGVIGQNFRSTNIQSYKLSKGDILIMHSDGVKENYKTAHLPDVLFGNSEEIATNIVNKLGKDHDDRACFILKH